MEIEKHEKSPFSVRNKIKRSVWNICYILFVRYSPRPFHTWRNLILRSFGAKINKGVHIYPKAKIWAPWNLEMKELSCIGNDAIIYNQAKIIVGINSVISQGCHLCSGTHDYSQPEFPLISKPIIIGNEVWLAADVFVHPGVSIGDGTVIGARSVVTKSVESWKVASGFPCEIIKERIIEKA